MSANVTVTVTVSDANDFPPIFLRGNEHCSVSTLLTLCSLGSYNVSISESILVGAPVIRTEATDVELDAITYSIVDGDEVSHHYNKPDTIQFL